MKNQIISYSVTVNNQIMAKYCKDATDDNVEALNKFIDKIFEKTINPNTSISQ